MWGWVDGRCRSSRKASRRRMPSGATASSWKPRRPFSSVFTSQCSARDPEQATRDGDAAGSDRPVARELLVIPVQLSEEEGLLKTRLLELLLASSNARKEDIFRAPLPLSRRSVKPLVRTPEISLVGLPGTPSHPYCLSAIRCQFVRSQCVDQEATSVTGRRYWRRVQATTPQARRAGQHHQQQSSAKRTSGFRESSRKAPSLAYSSNTSSSSSSCFFTGPPSTKSWTGVRRRLLSDRSMHHPLSRRLE
jgi:hypothetical protein